MMFGIYLGLGVMGIMVVFLDFLHEGGDVSVMWGTKGALSVLRGLGRSVLGSCWGE